KIRHGASGAIKYHISVADPRKGGIHVIRYASSRKVSGLWFLFVPSAFQFGVFRQVGFSGRCFPDINSLALEIQRIASINFWASARLGQLAHLEIRF
ncbi:hypothetical protein, partial [Vibrio vulnificus]|uniref:hypothetical protein n=1 Tax=Vibrio vulnificus TaxID=672 RepID=UPI003EDAA35A